MLTIQIPEIELFNQETQEFIYTKATTLNFENSLLSISKWESKWKIPFPNYQTEMVRKVKNIDFNPENFSDYLRCMCLTPNADPLIFKHMPYKCLVKIKDYLEDPMTATTINSIDDGKNRGKMVTNELVYFWMASYGIPFDPCQKWHINRLLTLIQIASIENAPKQKMTPNEINSKYRALNKARRKPK